MRKSQFLIAPASVRGRTASGKGELSPHLKPTLKSLEEGRRHDAVRRFVGAAIDGHIPRGRTLATWLSRELGAAATRELVHCFAEYPCFVCRGGLELCEPCAGKGRVRGALCEQCVGLGATICRFCGGSGWVTINFVPQGLRSLVIFNRIQLARTQIGELLKSHRASRGGRNRRSAKRGRRVLASDVVRWNRVMAILENAILALRLSCSREPLPNKFLTRWIIQCARLGKRADQHVRLSLRYLAEELDGNSEDGEFYLELAANPTMSSEIEHPFLRRAIQAIQPRQSKRGLSGPK